MTHSKDKSADSLNTQSWMTSGEPDECQCNAKRLSLHGKNGPWHCCDPEISSKARTHVRGSSGNTVKIQLCFTLGILIRVYYWSAVHCKTRLEKSSVREWKRGIKSL